MAGHGDPWSAISRERLQIMLALHDGLDFKQTAQIFNISYDQLKNELAALIESSLVLEKNNKYYPTVFIANQSEAIKVIELSKTYRQ